MHYVEAHTGKCDEQRSARGNTLAYGLSTDELRNLRKLAGGRRAVEDCTGSFRRLLDQSDGVIVLNPDRLIPMELAVFDAFCRRHKGKQVFLMRNPPAKVHFHYHLVDFEVGSNSILVNLICPHKRNG